MTTDADGWNAADSPDYRSLLDERMHAFIARTHAAFPADAGQRDINEQRLLYDAMCREFRVPYPPDTSSHDTRLAAPASSFAESTTTRPVPIRTYYSHAKTSGNEFPHLIYLHGGGFVVGGLDSHDDVCAEISHFTGLTLTSVDYRLSPEHRHPAALHDVMYAIRLLWQQSRQPLILCGDSAGANLCAAACHALRGEGNPPAEKDPVILGQVLIYPGLGGDTRRGSYVRHANAPMLSTADVEFYSRIRSRSESDRSDPLFAPLQDHDFSDLPATVAFSAECDPLCDDAVHYCDYIRQAGGRAHCINEQGLVHGYLRARHSVDRAAASFARIIDAISALAARQWPYL